MVFVKLNEIRKFYRKLFCFGGVFAMGRAGIELKYIFCYIVCMLGNRLTQNALTADDAKDLIERALGEMENDYGWIAQKNHKLFTGVYYDTSKVGSYIVKTQNKAGEAGVLKLQLRPLPFDEGFIIRHIEKQNKSRKVRMPEIYTDEKWSEKRGYGFLVFEDLSDMPHLWNYKFPITDKERENYKFFLKEFLHNVLPIKPWLEKPKESYKEIHSEAYKHFQKIAQNSLHKHIGNKEVEKITKKYFEVMNKCEFNDLNFTHAHLSGLDIKYDKNKDEYILLANLLWSYRPKYYELTFPMWIDIMHIRNKNLTFDDFLQIINGWSKHWQRGLYDEDPTSKTDYWFNLLTRAALTIMLDLGASEWKDDEKDEKNILLERWKEFFEWLIKNKF